MNDLNSIVKFKFDVFCQAVNDCIHGRDEEAIHDIRVGCRRMTEVLGVLGIFNITEGISDLKEVFDGIRKNLSDIRDTEVMIALLQSEKLRVHNQQEPEQSFLAEYFSEELRNKKILADETVRKIDIPFLQELIVRFAESNYSSDKSKDGKKVTDRSYFSAVKKTIQRKEKTVREKFRNVKQRQKPKDIHAFRIAVKKARYILEFVNEIGILKAGKKVKRYEKIQQVLGEYCDLMMLESNLKRIRNIQEDSSEKKNCTILLKKCKEIRTKQLRKILKLKID